MNNVILLSKFQDNWEIYTSDNYYLKATNLQDLSFYLNLELSDKNIVKEQYKFCYITDKDNYSLQKKRNLETDYKEYDYIIRTVKSKNKEKVNKIWQINKNVCNDIKDFTKKMMIKRAKIVPFSSYMDIDHNLDCLEIYILGCTIVFMYYYDDTLILERHYHLDYALLHQNIDCDDLCIDFFSKVANKINLFLREYKNYHCQVAHVHLVNGNLKKYLPDLITRLDIRVTVYD